MAAAADETWWRRMLAIGFLSFAALGLAGCDESGSSGGEGTEQEAPAGGSEGGDDEGGEDDGAGDDGSTPEGEGPTEGEHPAEQGQEEDEEQDDG
ncbi:hypothetical protein RCG67_01360 [Kocuria sp. CPCC 205292]|uniref:hypothetical protein n=1 Tax=Kocuria cellulosilytica TaxID=3071451 RepID=UPI0034D5F8F0